MKTVQKWLCVCLVLALVGALCGCGGDVPEETPDNKPDTSTTTSTGPDSAAFGDESQEESATGKDTTTTASGSQTGKKTEAGTTNKTQPGNSTAAGTTKVPFVETSQATGKPNSSTPGTKDNPVSLVIGSNKVTLTGKGEYYYSWTATDDVALVLQFTGSGNTGWEYRVSNLTAGDDFTKTSNSSQDSAEATTYISAFKGDKILVAVNTHNGSAGKVTVDASLIEEWGTEKSPITIAVGDTNHLRVPAGKTVYFSGRTQNTTMVLKGASNSVLKFDGNTYALDGGQLTLKMPQSQGGKAEVLDFALTNNTGKIQAYSVSCNFPTGTTDNPAKVNLGSNSVQIEAGSQYGYVYEWTATAKGKVTITMSGSNWHYEILNINNMVQEQSTSDLDDAAKEATISVKKGHVVRITINTSDGEAAKVSFNFKFN